MVRVHASLRDGSQLSRLRLLLTDFEAALEGNCGAEARDRLEQVRADGDARRDVFEAYERLSRLKGLFPELEASDGPLLRKVREYFFAGSLAAQEA